MIPPIAYADRSGARERLWIGLRRGAEAALALVVALIAKAAEAG